VTPRPARPRGAAPLAARALSELAVLVQFGELIVAVAAQHVSRIVLADDAAVVPDSPGSVRIGDAVLPAWELGKLLALADAPAAWLILATGDDPGAPRIALGTGPCVAVAPHDEISPLPPGVVSVPPAAVLGVFVTDPALRARGIGPLGVRIDPVRLIGAPAIAAASRRPVGER
jgi:hypothetical protein